MFCKKPNLLGLLYNQFTIDLLLNAVQRLTAVLGVCHFFVHFRSSNCDLISIQRGRPTRLNPNTIHRTPFGREWTLFTKKNNKIYTKIYTQTHIAGRALRGFAVVPTDRALCVELRDFEEQNQIAADRCAM